MIRTISLQLKLIVLVSIITLAMTGIIVIFEAKSLQESVNETFYRQLTGITTAINGRYEESRSVEDVQQMFDYIQLRNSEVVELSLHGQSGKVLVSTNRELIDSPSPEYIRQSLDEGKTLAKPDRLPGDIPAARLMAPLLEDGSRVGVIELLLNAAEEEELIRNKVDHAIMIGILSSSGFLIVLWFSLRKLMVRPLMQLREAAFAVKMGESISKVELNASLEIVEVADAFNDMVADLDERYRELQQALHTLQRTQEQLVQSEKMVALGRLVAGVAHEINTPIGVGVTAASFLEQRTNEFVVLYQQNKMKKSDLDGFLKSTQETTEMIQSNLRRASELIKSFKQVSVDQSSEQKRSFRLLDYIEEVVRSLQPTIKKSRQRVTIFGDRDFEVNTYPGIVSQIVTNFVMNSLIHAYEPEEEGYIMFRVTRENGHLIVQYADDGKGMPKEIVDKIFDPFFTTNRSQGGTGLGMHIVYNLVTQKLGGTISCSSEVGRGTTFIIDIPFPQEEKHELQTA